MPNIHVPAPQLTGGGWSRAVLYVLTVLAAVIAGVGAKEGWAVADTAQSVLYVLAALTGGTATLNLSKAPDQHTPKIGEVWQAFGELAESVNGLLDRAPDEAAPGEDVVTVAVAESRDVAAVPRLPSDLPHYDRS